MLRCTWSGASMATRSAFAAASPTVATRNPSPSALAQDGLPRYKPTTTLTPLSRRFWAWAWPWLPYLVSRVTKASTFSPLPVTSSVIVLSVRSTTLARKTLAISMISSRVPGVTLTLISASSRSTAGVLSSDVARSTSTSLRSCLANCSVRSGAVSTTIVIREMLGSSVGPTDRLWMFTPRLRISPATRTSTPGAFCTSTEMVAACCRSVIQDHLRHRLPGRNHRQAVLLRVAEDVDHARHTFRGQRGAQGPLNLFGPLDADAACAVGVGQFGEVRVAQDG